MSSVATLDSPQQGDGSASAGGSEVYVEWYARSGRGSVRSTNQDAFRSRGAAFVVCDGMGGASGGAVAAEMAADYLSKLWGESPGPLTAIDSGIEDANRAIVTRSLAEPALSGMGTTLVAVAAVEVSGHLQFVGVCVGDSRLYSVGDGCARQVSRDHSVTQELVDSGAISPGEVATHPDRHVITRALGSPEVPRADWWLFDVHPGDRFLLTTDGVHGLVPEDALLQLLSSGAPEDVVESLVAAALAAGGSDNLTALVVDVLEVDGGHGQLDDDTRPRPYVDRAARPSTIRRVFSTRRGGEGDGD